MTPPQPEIWVDMPLVMTLRKTLVSSPESECISRLQQGHVGSKALLQ